MLDAMLMAKKKNKVIVDPGNILLLSHMETDPPINLVDGQPFIKTGTGTGLNAALFKFGSGSLRAARSTIGDMKFNQRERLDPDAWTIEGWFYHGAEGGSGTGRGALHFTHGYNPTNGGFGLRVRFTAYMANITMKTSSSGSDPAPFIATAPSGKNFYRRFEHFALVRELKQIRAYIGGVRVLVQNNVAQHDDRSLQCMIGYTGTFDSSHFDEWRITNRQSLYNDDFTPQGPFTELVVEYTHRHTPTTPLRE